MDSETVTYIVQLLHSNGLYAAEDALLRELEERCPEPAGMQPFLPDPPEHSAVTFPASVGLQQDHVGEQEQSTRQAVQDRWCSPQPVLCYQERQNASSHGVQHLKLQFSEIYQNHAATFFQLYLLRHAARWSCPLLQAPSPTG